MIYDLRTRTGCINYVEQVVLVDVRKAFAQNGKLHSFGIVFASRTQGQAHNMPHPHMLGAVGMEPRVLKRMMQKVVNQTAAVGCVYVRQAEFSVKHTEGVEYKVDAICVQLEHAAVGDLLWNAEIKGKRLETFTEALSLELSVLAVRPTTFMPERWMS